MRFKTIHNGNLVEVEPHIDFHEDNDGEGTLFDDAGNKTGTARVYGWNIEDPYIDDPLYFIFLPSLTAEQRFQLIKLFEGWYGDTDQDVSIWATEFELIVRMLCYETCALVINPMFLEMDKKMYEKIIDIVYPPVFENIEDVLEKDFFSILPYGDQRIVTFYGYIYDSGDSNTDDEYATYRIVEYSGMDMPLTAYLADKGNYDKSAESVRQHIEDADAERVLYAANHWFENIRVTCVPEITEDLPNGYYCCNLVDGHEDHAGESCNRCCATCRYIGLSGGGFFAECMAHGFQIDDEHTEYCEDYESVPEDAIQKIEFAGPYTVAGVVIGSCGRILISEEAAKKWDLYPDWEKRQTMTDKPCLFYRETTDGLKIFMPVGDFSQSPIEPYLHPKLVDCIYDDVSRMKPVAIYAQVFEKGENEKRKYVVFSKQNNDYIRICLNGYEKESETIVSKDVVEMTMENVRKKIQNWPKDAKGGYEIIKEFRL